MSDKKIESLAYRLKDYESLRALFAELNFEFADKPVNKEHWNQDQIDMVQEAKIIAKKEDYRIYYIQTNTDSLTQWKGIATKIIKENNGLCLICSHNPSGFKWVFSSLSKDFSQSFTETRHVPIDIRPDIGVPQTFVEFLEKIKINKDSTASSIASQISGAFDSFAVTIHDELTVNVFEALKSLSEGIILDESNDLTLDVNTLEEIREPTFILLYRIIFILYAEDRGIFPVEHKIYHEKFSFKWLKQEWILKSENQKKLSIYQVHERLWNFFRLIELGSEDLGYDSNEFFMRSYYGRIFDKNINQKLDKWKIKNQYLLDAVSLLTRTRDKNGNYFFLDYSALETRHLGSIYEHLLEYHLTVKGKKIADLPDQQERKSSGSYYTPQYIVDNIIQNTIEPLISKIRKDTKDKFEQIEKILSLNILDPAMGSGHFLIGVVNYIANRICEIEDEEITEQRLIERKRDVVRRCVYGVDINPLAVDLAMVSLWLETLSSEKPLSFLSAHLKYGNSLIGSQIDMLFDKQTTLMESQKGREQFKKTIKDFLMFENLEDSSASAVKTKIEKYQSIQSKGTIYYNVKSLLDCKVAESFGIKTPIIADFKTKIGENSLDFFTDESWQKIQQIALEHRFFHWDLEFPDIFYDSDGKKKLNSGFDCIIGNPPYLKLHTMDKDQIKYFYKKYTSATKHFDMYVLFIEAIFTLLNTNGTLGFILPSKFFNADYGEGIRKYLGKHSCVLKLVNFKDYQIWKKISTYTCLLFLQNSHIKDTEYFEINNKPKLDETKILSSDIFNHATKIIPKDGDVWNFSTGDNQELLDKLENTKLRLDDISKDIFAGLQTGRDWLFFVEKIKDEPNNLVKIRNDRDSKEHVIEKDLLKKVLKGKEIRRWQADWKNLYIIYPYYRKDGVTTLIPIKEIKSKFPKTFQYFLTYKKELMTSDTSEAVNETNFYRFRRARSIDQFECPKIITQVLASRSSFALDIDENYYFVGGGNAGGFGILLNDKYEKMSYAILAILNSKTLEFYLKSTSSPFQRGFYSYGKRFIVNLPIEIPSDKQLDILTKLTKKQLILKKQTLELSTSKNDKINPIVIESNLNEEKIEDVIYEIYNITDLERKTIEQKINEV